MSKVIKVSVTKVWGSVTIYPVCDAAKLFAGIAGTKTLTHKALVAIEALGYELELVPAAYKVHHASA